MLPMRSMRQGHGPPGAGVIEGHHSATPQGRMADYDLSWLDDSTQLHDVLLSELPADMWDFAPAILRVYGGCQLLAFLLRRPAVSMTAGDLAFMIGEEVAEIQEALNLLEAQGVIVARPAAGTMLYRLTSHEEIVSRVRAFDEWREWWLARLRRVGEALQVG